MKVSLRRSTLLSVSAVIATMIAFAPLATAQQASGRRDIRPSAANRRPFLFIAADAYMHRAIPAAIAVYGTGTTEVKERPQASTLGAAPSEVFSHGDPTAEEQYMLEMINRARANPTEEGKRLAATTDPATSSAYTYFNIDRNKLKTDFATYPAKPPLAFNDMLIKAARGHSTDMSTNDFMDHVGHNGSTFTQRMEAQGYNGYIYAGENIFAYGENYFYMHAGFLVDWGNDDPGHRRNILNFDSTKPVFNEVGIGLIHDSHPSPHTGPMIITEDFGARQGIVYLTGVVYRDINGNNLYDIGEGLAGVTIMPSTGQYYAVTSTSGGYAIKMTVKASMQITASGGALGKTITKNVTMGKDNVKLDFTPDENSAPSAVQLMLPADGAIVSTPAAALRWQKIVGATKYQLQVSEDAGFHTILKDDSTLVDSNATFSAAANDVTYIWRVRARNATGWGPWATRSFRVLALPGAVELAGPATQATIPTNNARLSWHPGSQTVTRYWFEMATDAAFANIAVRDTAVTDTLRVVNGLTPATTYYWRAKAYNDAGWGPFSAAWTATTGASGVDVTAGASAGLTLATAVPNPVVGTTRIGFSLEHAAHATLEVFDASGAAVAVLADRDYAAGAYNVTWDAAGIPAGAYLCVLRAGALTRAMSVIVVH